MFWFSEGSISLWWSHLCRPCYMNIVHMLLVVQVSRIEDSWYWDEDFAMLSGFAFLWKLVIFTPWLHGIAFEGFFSSLWVLLVYGWGFFLWIKPWIICRQICFLKNSQGNHAFCFCKNGILVSYTIVPKQLRLYRLGIEIQPSQFSSVYFITCKSGWPLMIMVWLTTTSIRILSVVALLQLLRFTADSWASFLRLQLWSCTSRF